MNVTSFDCAKRRIEEMSLKRKEARTNIFMFCFENKGKKYSAIVHSLFIIYFLAFKNS